MKRVFNWGLVALFLGVVVVLVFSADNRPDRDRVLRHSNPQQTEEWMLHETRRQKLDEARGRLDLIAQSARMTPPVQDPAANAAEADKRKLTEEITRLEAELQESKAKELRVAIASLVRYCQHTVSAWVAWISSHACTQGRDTYPVTEHHSNSETSWPARRRCQRKPGCQLAPSSSAISRSRISTCLRSSRAMPELSPGDRSRSSTRASCSRFLTSARWPSVCSG
jgi:hypothetical protein